MPDLKGKISCDAGIQSSPGEIRFDVEINSNSYT
jgi:hypothetical protein